MAQETPSVITEITSNSNWKTNTKKEFNLQNDILNQNYRQLVSNSEHPLTKKNKVEVWKYLYIDFVRGNRSMNNEQCTRRRNTNFIWIMNC